MGNVLDSARERRARRSGGCERCWKVTARQIQLIVLHHQVANLNSRRTDILDRDSVAERRTLIARSCANGSVRASEWRATIRRPANDFLGEKDPHVANPHDSSLATGIRAAIGREHIVDRVTTRTGRPDLDSWLIICTDNLPLAGHSPPEGYARSGRVNVRCMGIG